MRPIRVIEIIKPPSPNLAESPRVKLEDPLVRAIELMAKNNVQQIAVVTNERTVGMIRLKDALEKMGLQVDAL